MKAYISYSGTLKVLAENKNELYALKRWIEASIKYSDDENIINVLMGSFDIDENFTDYNEGKLLDCSLLDHIVEAKK